MKHGISLFAAATMTLCAGAALAQSIGEPEDQIRWRQAAYQSMGWSMHRIKANLEGEFNAQQVAKAANVIQALANSGLGALYGAGTDKGVGYHETGVKPEVFSDREGVGKVAKAFNMEANAMAKVAAGGDMAAVKAQFGKLGKTCKACHEDYRKKDDHKH